jgi:hypothetical protein
MAGINAIYFTIILNIHIKQQVNRNPAKPKDKQFYYNPFTKTIQTEHSHVLI